MMKELSATIISELQEQVSAMIGQAKYFQQQSSSQLNTSLAEGKWSVIECFEHMNLYSNVYVKEFEYQITQSKYPADKYHKSGWLGGYSYRSMLPQNGNAPMSMNTFKYMNPTFKGTSDLAINQFIKQQELMLTLLEKSKGVSLQKTRCKTTLKFIKFNLGDTLKFYVYHNMRHMNQAENVLKVVE